MKKRTTKPRMCRRCRHKIDPELESHAGITLKLRSCNGAGGWVENAYKPLYLCGPCWEIVDDVVAGPTA